MSNKFEMFSQRVQACLGQPVLVVVRDNQRTKFDSPDPLTDEDYVPVVNLEMGLLEEGDPKVRSDGWVLGFPTGGKRVLHSSYGGSRVKLFDADVSTPWDLDFKSSLQKRFDPRGRLFELSRELQELQHDRDPKQFPKPLELFQLEILIGNEAVGEWFQRSGDIKDLELFVEMMEALGSLWIPQFSELRTKETESVS